MDLRKVGGALLFIGAAFEIITGIAAGSVIDCILGIAALGIGLWLFKNNKGA